MSLLLVTFTKMILFITASAQAGPIIVGNGGGVSEFYLVYAQPRLVAAAELCLASQDCVEGLTRDVVFDLEQLSRDRYVLGLKLEIRSEAEVGPRLFEVERGILKVNQDRLVNEGPHREWSYGQALAFYTRVAADHYGWSPIHTVLIGRRLLQFGDASFVRANNTEAHFRALALVQFEAPFSTLVIEDMSSHHPPEALEVPFAKTLNCLASSGVSGPLQRIKVIGSRWLPVDRDKARNPIVTAAGRLNYLCLDKSGIERSYTSRFWVRVRTQFADLMLNQDVSLKPETMTLGQDRIRRVPSL